MDGLMMKYFVLKPKSKTAYDHYATASRSALRAYANAIEVINPELANNLRQWADLESRNAKDMRPENYAGG